MLDGDAPLRRYANDTGEYFLGRIAVTPVFLESTGQTDTSSEDWNSTHSSQVLANIQQGLEWWNDLLDTKSSIHNLDFVVDDQYAVTPSPTIYEPINRVSNDYALWVPEFLNRVGYNQSNSLDENMRAFNNAQRLKHNADWSFTILWSIRRTNRTGLLLAVEFLAEPSHLLVGCTSSSLQRVQPRPSLMKPGTCFGPAMSIQAVATILKDAVTITRKI